MNAQLEKWRSQAEQAKQQLLSNAYVQQAQRWYGQQTSRDQGIIKAVALLLVATMIFVLFYAPLLKARSSAEQSLSRNLKTYNLIASNAGRFGGAAGGDASVSILAAVTNQAKAQNLNLSRYEQDGVNLRIWLDRVAFDEAISWLEALESKYGISAAQISIDKTDSVGRVDVRATLGRN